MKDKECGKCNGRGQTKDTRTEFHFDKRKLPNGRVRDQYITDHKGSGCSVCCGTGRIDADTPRRS